ncbi:MAG TPA: hypothetical protein VH682_14945 [Gemmataceae bacterium]|jgi:hypothetical protein
MRPANWFFLLVLCLFVGSVYASLSLAARPAPRGPKAPLIKEEFQGYGQQQKEAEADALKQACDWLSTHENLGWTPPPEFLRDKGMVRFGESSEKVFEKAGPMKVVSMELEISADQARAIQKQARHERMTSRHLLLARVLGGVVCLLLVVGGYLRLEEATKGYYTRLLRVAAITFLILVGLGLCVIA